MIYQNNEIEDDFDEEEIDDFEAYLDKLEGIDPGMRPEWYAKEKTPF